MAKIDALKGTLHLIPRDRNPLWSASLQKRGGLACSVPPGQPPRGACFAKRERSVIVRRAKAPLCGERRPTGLATGGQMAWTRAAALAEIKERGVMDVDVGGEEIALYWVDDSVYA